MYVFFKYPHLVVSTEMGKRKYKQKKGGGGRGRGQEERRRWRSPVWQDFLSSSIKEKLKNKKERWKANIFAA